MEFTSSDVREFTQAELMSATRQIREELEDRLERFLRTDESIRVFLAAGEEDDGPLCVSVFLTHPDRAEPQDLNVFYDLSRVYAADIPVEQILETITRDIEEFLTGDISE